jgi:CheY-like chemotaxis protein
MLNEKIDILLIEDNIHDARFIKYAADTSGLKLNILRLPDGAEAIDYMYGAGQYEGRNTSDIPKMILTDLRMPKLDGYALLQKLKGDESTRDIPVVVMTTSSSENDIERSYSLGANSFLIKPMEIDVFIDKLIKVFNYWLLVNIVKGDGFDDSGLKAFCQF